MKETEELIKLEMEHGTKVQVALNRRHYSVIQKALKSIGGAKNLDMLSIEWSEAPRATKNKKGFSDLLIAKHLYANSIHGLDILDHFSEGIKDYKIFCASKTNYFHWQMAFSGIANHGTIVNFTSSWSSPVPWRIQMYSKGKRLEFAPLETCKVYNEQKQDFTIIEPDSFDVDYKSGFYLQAKTFLELIHSDNLIHKNNLASTLTSMQIAEEMFNKLHIE